MLLTTEKQGDITNVVYESSNILTSSFNGETKDLIITFKNGGQYKYKGVTLTDYTRFELAESQGKILNTFIKKYPFEKLTNVNVGPILEQIQLIKFGTNKEQIND